MICIKCGHAYETFTHDYIINVVAKFHHIEPQSMFRICREEPVRIRRQITQYLLYGYTVLSLKEIGKLFSQDHTTVINSRWAIQDRIDTDDDFKYQIVLLTESLGTPLRSLRPKLSSPKPKKKYKEIVRSKEKTFVRQKGIYSNTTPYGIASELLKTA